MCEHEPKHAKGLCAKCYQREWYGANADKNRARAREWSRANPEKNHARARGWQKANPEKARERARKWSRANAEKERERKHKWAQDNPEKKRESGRKWAQANSEKGREYACRRRALKFSAGGSWTAHEWAILKRQYGHRCVSCWRTESQLKTLGRKLVPDHIIPLAKNGRSLARLLNSNRA
jgi:hypothetical protein